MKATLSGKAWDAYEAGLDNEESMKGDVLVCKRITVVSTPYGQPDRRIQVKIEDLEFAGENIRRPVGQPVPIVQRQSVMASLEKMKQLRLKEYEIDAMDEDVQRDDNDNEEEDEPSSDENNDDAHEDKSGKLGPSRSDPKPPSNEVLPLNRGLESGGQPQGSLNASTTPSRNEPDPTLSSARKSATSDQIDTQIFAEALQTQAATQARKPVRRTRGGSLLAREGFEVARGDNLAGPQAPTLNHRRVSLPTEESNNPLMNILNTLPRHGHKRKSPEPSAPVSAQQVTEEIVVETPSQPKRSLAMSTAQSSSQPQPKRYRVPLDQRRLLESP